MLDALQETAVKGSLTLWEDSWSGASPKKKTGEDESVTAVTEFWRTSCIKSGGWQLTGCVANDVVSDTTCRGLQLIWLHTDERSKLGRSGAIVQALP